MKAIYRQRGKLINGREREVEREGEREVERERWSERRRRIYILERGEREKKRTDRE